MAGHHPISVSSKSALNQSAIPERFHELLGEGVWGIERISGGRNTTVFRVDTETRGTVILKDFFSGDDLKRDRFRTELEAVNFMRRNGVRSVPRIVASDPETSMIVYECVVGNRIETATVTEQDIDAACEFLTILDRLKLRPGAEILSPASEACFSIGDVIRNLRYRYERLAGAIRPDSTGKLALRFLEQKLWPLFSSILSSLKNKCRILNVPYDTAIPLNQRTLSPSDFGFHNALRTPDRGLVFFDFEYFGWDDPAKTITDFVLHPAMDLNVSLKERFVRTMKSRYAASEGLRNRLLVLFPLFGIKWSLILLNEFIPAEVRRRQRAVRFSSAELQDIQLRQLEKAEKMIRRAETAIDERGLFAP